MKLYSTLYGARPNKILIVAEYAQNPITHEVTRLDQLKSAEFLQKNPLGKLPVLETPEGNIFESNAIVRYLAKLHPEKNLIGKSLYEQGLVDQWLDFTAIELEPMLIQLLIPIFGWGDYQDEKWRKAAEELHHLLKVLDKSLNNKTYLVGNSITIADIVIASTLVEAYRVYLDEENRKHFPNVTNWFLHISSQQYFLRYFGKVRLCQEQFIPKGGHHHHHHETQHQEQQQQEQTKEVQEETPQQQIPPTVDYQHLPPSSFDLFEFKAKWVNTADKKEPLEYFWNKYDPQGYSIWYIQYEKAEGEGRVLFMTNNLMSSMLQKLEKFRKNAFAIHGVFGEEPNLEIRGVWLWRGPGIAPDIQEYESQEYYHKRKLDHNNPKDRQLVEEYWGHIEEDVTIVNGLKARTIEYF